MVAPHTRHEFASSEVHISYRLFGRPSSRSPMLFVHGLSYFSYDWVDFGTTLCQNRAGCALDMRGFGDSSESPTADYKISTMAEDIQRVLDDVGWNQAVIVAHSMGARSATCFTARNPERVTGLVLLDWSPENASAGALRVATTVANTPDLFKNVSDALAYFVGDAQAPARHYARYEAYLRPVPGGFEVKRSKYFRDQFRRQLETGQRVKPDLDLWQLVAEVDVPTLLLHGTRSDLFPPEGASRMQQANPRIQVLAIAAGHDIAGENPEATRVAIESFINVLETP